ncbi:beta-N-acetylhexosaminidase [Gellertiella hungarica]|uniref:beta-N-acetylhexosaminidase n=1 Tax=Gellertiella hungarica TaxID=1572859 RepID=A0A7W6J781_9HYPH|nr:beta-N-acetylhexosaminidase [Gellertiella hungarica]MBB4066088.1 hexosaminidase [Gellertiella hungarica]
MPARPAFLFETEWVPAADGTESAYILRMTNRSGRSLAGFSLTVSGPGRVDPSGEVEGARIEIRLSNHTRFVPPEGMVLADGDTWSITVRKLSWQFRHWNDGARGAYLTLADGSTVALSVRPTASRSSNAPFRRGAELWPVPAVPPVPVSVIPWPEEVAVGGRRPLPAGLTPKAADAEGEAAIGAFSGLVEALFPADGLVRSEAEGGLPVLLHRADGMGAEAYRIDFAADAVSVRASTRTGLLYGLVTLGQIWRGARLHPASYAFPATGHIEDRPEMGWRGMHLDVARQFYATAEIRRLLAILAWNKLNRFHWHLTDDEAWRIEIEAYPALTEIGAWRGEGLPIPALLGTGAERSGGYYTKAAVREIVALAGELGIEVVPEIDLPGHSFALLAALPELRDPAEQGEYQSVQGFPNNCINPAREKTYEVLETIFDELVELFPFRTIHVGADEVPLGAWSGSPEALALLERLAGREAAQSHARRLNVLTNTHGADDIEGSGAAVLQAVFLERVQKMLAARGCITGGWEEAAHGNVIDREKSYLCGWRSVEVCAALARQGYEMVVCPGQVYYLDMANSPDWAEPGASWAGWADCDKLYHFDPVEGWSEAERRKLRGIQACLWSESALDRAIVDRLVFPRLSALAESAWTRPGAKSFERFKAIAALMPVLYGYP